MNRAVTRWSWLLPALAATVLAGVVLVANGAAGQAASAPYAPCAAPQIAAPRVASNPLALPQRPGTDPLRGAHLFVEGPRNGTVAEAIERLLKLSNAYYTDADTWTAFRRSVLATLPLVRPAVATGVRELFEIGDQEETEPVSYASNGGGRGAIAAQVRTILCDNMAADPTPATVPVLSTLFAPPHGVFCAPARVIAAWSPTFQRLVREMKGAIGRARAVILMELSSIGNSRCLGPPALKDWLRELRFEATQFSQLPHAVIYLEAGSAYQLTALRAAQLLDVAGVTLTRGFFVNDAGFDWAARESSWATAVSRDVTAMVAAAHPKEKQPYVPHFVINTAEDGTGPLLSQYPIKGAAQVTCNPPGRGLGRKPTADTAPTFDGFSFPLADAFLWTGLPGRSHGSNCSQGAPAAGVFDLDFALQLAQLANQQLGPLFPSEPYRAPILTPVTITGIAGTSATLTGSVDPNGLSSTAHFEYGLDPEYTGGGPVVYGQSTAGVSAGSDSVYHPVSATVTGLTPGALYDVRLVATNNGGTSQSPNGSFNAAPSPPPPPPVLGQTENLEPVSGVIFIKLPQRDAPDELVSAALSKGSGFVPLFDARQLPSGTQVDARRGTLMLATAPATGYGKPQLATLSGAIFTLTQGRHGLTKGLTTISLVEGDYPGLPSYASCPRAAADGPRGQAARASPKVLQTLKATDDHGKFRTQGRYSSATVRGTEWETIDRCDGTLTAVERGTVEVYDEGTRKTVTVHAGHSYLAKAFALRDSR